MASHTVSRCPWPDGATVTAYPRLVRQPLDQSSPPGAVAITTGTVSAGACVLSNAGLVAGGHYWAIGLDAASQWRWVGFSVPPLLEREWAGVRQVVDEIADMVEAGTIGGGGDPAGLAAEVARAEAAEGTIGTALSTLAGKVGAPNGIAPLDSSSKVPLANLPSGIGGGVVVKVDDVTETELDVVTTGLHASDVGASVAYIDGEVEEVLQISTDITAEDIGGILASEKGAANGVATLDGTGKVPSSQLPAGGSSGTLTETDPVATAALSTHAGLTTTAHGIGDLLAGKADTVHTHAWADLRDPPGGVVTQRIGMQLAPFTTAASTAQQSLAALSVPAGQALPGDELLFRAFGSTFNFSGGAANLAFALLLGGTQIASTGNASQANLNFTRGWVLDLYVVVVDGTTLSYIATLEQGNGVSAPSPPSGGTGWQTAVNTALWPAATGLLTLDTTAQLNFDFKVTPGTAIDQTQLKATRLSASLNRRRA